LDAYFHSGINHLSTGPGFFHPPYYGFFTQGVCLGLRRPSSGADDAAAWAVFPLAGVSKTGGARRLVKSIIFINYTTPILNSGIIWNNSKS